jgi:hypothetical protein
MELLEKTLVVLHLVGMAMVLGAWVVGLRSSPRVIPGAAWHGILTQVITGLLLAGVVPQVDGDDLADFFYPKIGIKLVIALVVFAIIVVNRKRTAVPNGAYLAIGVLEIVNIVIAVFWT